MKTFCSTVALLVLLANVGYAANQQVQIRRADCGTCGTVQITKVTMSQSVETNRCEGSCD